MNDQKKKKKGIWGSLLVFVIYIAIGVVCGILLGNSLDALGDVSTGRIFLSVAVFLLELFVADILQLILHEAGHLVFGLMTGYGFSSFRIMSFMWVKESGKIRFRRLSIAGTGGQCLMTPPDLVDGNMPVVLYNLGGVILNLIVSAIAFGLTFAVSNIRPLFEIFMLIALLGVGIALSNGIPLRTATVDNDGYNAFSLRRDKKALYAFWVQMKVNEQVASGVRIKDMPSEWFEIPSDEGMKNSMIATLGVFACNRMVDAHEFGEASEKMKHLLEIDSGIVGIYRNLMVCDLIYIELITENRKDVLDGFLTKEQKKFAKAMKNFPSVIRTEYAYALLCERDQAKADASKALFEKCAKTYPYPNDIASDRELMELAESKIEKEEQS